MADTATAVDAPEPEQFAAVGELISSAPTIVNETKAGYKTTEFWIVIVTALTTVFTDIPLPDDSKGFVLAGLAGLYAIARGLAKKGVPQIPEQ